MRSKFTPIYTFFAFLSVVFLFTSSIGGRSDDRAGAPGDATCTGCHSGGGLDTQTGGVTFTGLPTNIQANETINFQVVVTQPTGQNLSQAVAGFQIVATDGTNNTELGIFTPVNGENTQGVQSSTRLTHTSPNSHNGSASTSWEVSYTAPSSTLPTNLVFYASGNAANGNGNNGGGDYPYNTSQSVMTGSSLAVNFLSFQTTPQSNGNILLQWQVADENQTNYYEIERSTDGKEFTTIATQSVDNQSNIYEYTDRVTIKNKTFYYRIKEVAADGKTQLSTIQTARVETAVATVLVYPNPAIAGENVQVEIPTNFTGQLQVINLQGQVITTQNVDKDATIIDLNTMDLANGIYSILLSNTNEFYQQKLVILK